MLPASRMLLACTARRCCKILGDSWPTRTLRCFPAKLLCPAVPQPTLVHEVHSSTHRGNFKCLNWTPWGSRHPTFPADRLLCTAAPLLSVLAAVPPAGTSCVCTVPSSRPSIKKLSTVNHWRLASNPVLTILAASGPSYPSLSEQFGCTGTTGGHAKGIAPVPPHNTHSPCPQSQLHTRQAGSLWNVKGQNSAPCHQLHP